MRELKEIKGKFKKFLKKVKREKIAIKITNSKSSESAESDASYAGILKPPPQGVTIHESDNFLSVTGNKKPRSRSSGSNSKKMSQKTALSVVQPHDLGEPVDRVSKTVH